MSGLSQGWFLSICFIPLNEPHFPVSMYIFGFFPKLSIWLLLCSNSGNQISSFPHGLLLLQLLLLLKVIVVHLFWDFQTTFKCYVCLCVLTEVSVLLAHVHLLFWNIFPWMPRVEIDKQTKPSKIKRKNNHPCSLYRLALHWCSPSPIS